MRRDPATLAEAARLVEAHGQHTGQALDRRAQAFNRWSHLREMPSD